MTDRLSLYNGALLLIGERKLASLDENREPRRVLDDVWNGGAVRYCLEQGLWNFAMRTKMLAYDPDFSPGFGYQYVFAKPEDWVRTAAVCSDEYFQNPITRYTDEGGYWFCDSDTIYVQYVSDDENYGTNYAGWPETFTQYAEAHMAFKSMRRLTQSKERWDDIKAEVKRLRIDARSKDAMNEPAKFPPQGSWVRARSGNIQPIIDRREQ